MIREIITRNGFFGLWRGTMPGMTRAALLTASQCATYDVIKRQVMCHSGQEDTAAAQIVSGAITGLVTTTVTAPADVLKTRMYCADCRRKGLVSTAVALVKDEGCTALLKGWVANYARLGPQTLITFLVAEQLRKRFGLNAL
jgi:solute carrier family 25 (mitochondrial uncoupling protein), member 8/9